MSRINDKLGMKPAGKRAFMNLPDDKAARNDLTAAQCPSCTRRGVREAMVHGKRLRTCVGCGHCWEPAS